MRTSIQHDSSTEAISSLVSRRPFSVAGDDLNLVHLGDFLAFTELDILEDKRPDVVAESIRVQIALEDELVLHPIGQGIVDALVKLKEDPERQIRRDLTQLRRWAPNP